MTNPVFANLGPQQRRILANSNIAGPQFDALANLRRAAFFDITFALVVRAHLVVEPLCLRGGTDGILPDRLFFDYQADFIASVRANTDQGLRTFANDTFHKHPNITESVRQAVAFMSLQIGWTEGALMEIDIDVGNPQNPAGIFMHSLELLSNHGLGKIGRFLHIPGARDHTDHTVLQKMLHARPV